MGPDQVNATLDRMLQGQSVMLATNSMMLIVAAAFILGACVIWLAPRPTRSVDMSQAGH
jgi:DHA2 family multidrug resistance protein